MKVVGFEISGIVDIDVLSSSDFLKLRTDIVHLYVKMTREQIERNIWALQEALNTKLREVK